MKTKERREARVLRRDGGLSIKEIARRVGVSQGSVSVWVRDIELTPEQHEELRRKNPAHNQLLNGRAVAAANRRAERIDAQERGRDLARDGALLHAAGCMLYWAEGTKDRNQVRFSNSDPEMMRFFAAFLRTCFGVRDDDMRVTCHLYADHEERQREVEDFWLDVLALPRSSLCKSIVNVYSKHSQRKRLNFLPYGTCRVVVSRTTIVQSIYGRFRSTQASSGRSGLTDGSPIRGARAEEAPALLAIQRAASVAAFAHIYPPEQYPFPADEVLGLWQEALREPSIDVYVAEFDGEPVGSVSVDDEWLRTLYVLPEHWSQGVGSRLLDHGLARMRERGAIRAKLWTLEENAAGRRFYENRGWTLTDETRVVPFPPHPVDVQYAKEL